MAVNRPRSSVPSTPTTPSRTSSPSGAAPSGAAPSGSAQVGFAELGVPSGLVDVLAAQDVTTPFPIQRATLPDSLAGRDVLGRGRTGSG